MKFLRSAHVRQACHAFRQAGIILPLCLLIPGVFLYGQVSTKVVSLSPAEATSNSSLTITMELQQGETIERAYFVYRPFGQGEYERMEMELMGNTARVTLSPAKVLPPFIEYYVVFSLRSGTLETYPLGESTDPFTTPPGKTLQIPVRAEQELEPQVIFLSPDRGARLIPEDVLISFSLLRADSNVVRQATQVLLDGVDVTPDAVFSDDIVVYNPENLSVRLSQGSHRVTVRLFNREGSLYRSASISFSVILPEAQLAEGMPRAFQYGVSLQYESRREQINNVGTWYNRGTVQLSGRSGEWRLSSNVFVTSDEKANRQPQNRYFAGIESPWLSVGYGDAYPVFPSLILSGKRVRGLNSSLKLGAFNLDVAIGKTVRLVEGELIKAFPIDSLTMEQQRDPASPYGQIDPRTWGKFSYGTYERSLFALRPSFGSGENWQLGFTYLKSKDDPGSIVYGVRPQENLVVGADFIVRFLDRHVELGGQGAFSAFNSDISSGTFNDAYIDSVYRNNASSIKSARDILQKYITVNDNLRPLSLSKLSTVAYDLSVGVNAFDNMAKVSYLFRGNDYNSFGQTFLRTDLRGFSVTDRIRVMNTGVFATVGVERLEDNTGNTKVATTKFNNLNMALSYYPEAEFPNITVGYARFENSNGLGVSDPDSLQRLNVVDDITNRFFVQTSYDFELVSKHRVYLNMSTSDRNDRSLRKFDVQNFTLAGGVNTHYAIPLETTVDFSINNNTLPRNTGAGTQGQKFNYTTLSFNGKYSMLRGTLSFITTISPTFGDFQRTVLDVGTQWNAFSTMTFLFQFSYFGNQGIPSDNVVSLRYRYSL